ncbi:MAG TPA: hypothetical protein VKR55_25445 [Bradyrhizobium sp.]|uniref:hypothetical protein n=1 Tax=Bradyrhizobium sp. TaxID=376 RepID=UPI002C09C5DC|nr:hypothetical protein [Bradyrhizobium sp.]HLZ05481.1 hypothetical protein [Bradyrhizobium sp.]
MSINTSKVVSAREVMKRQQVVNIPAFEERPDRVRSKGADLHKLAALAAAAVVITSRLHAPAIRLLFFPIGRPC